MKEPTRSGIAGFGLSDGRLAVVDAGPLGLQAPTDTSAPTPTSPMANTMTAIMTSSSVMPRRGGRCRGAGRGVVTLKPREGRRSSSQIESAMAAFPGLGAVLPAPCSLLFAPRSLLSASFFILVPHHILTAAGVAQAGDDVRRAGAAAEAGRHFGGCH